MTTPLAGYDPPPLPRFYPSAQILEPVQPIDPAMSYPDWLDASGRPDDATSAGVFAAGQRAAVRAGESRAALTSPALQDAPMLPGPAGPSPTLPPVPMPAPAAPARRGRRLRR